MKTVENFESDRTSAMITNALMTLDLGFLGVYPKVYAHSDYVADDGTNFRVSLVVYHHPYEEQEILRLRVSVDGMYYEETLAKYEEGLWDILQSAEIHTAIAEYVEELKKAGKTLMNERIEDEGITDIHSFVIPQENAGKKLQLHSLCKLSFKGEVFYGFEGLKRYCLVQEDDASPFILKRTVYSPIMHNMGYYCFMLCPTAERTEFWMDVFLALDFETLWNDEHLDYLIKKYNDDLPPIVSYQFPDGRMTVWY